MPAKWCQGYYLEFRRSEVMLSAAKPKNSPATSPQIPAAVTQNHNILLPCSAWRHAAGAPLSPVYRSRFKPNAQCPANPADSLESWLSIRPEGLV